MDTLAESSKWTEVIDSNMWYEYAMYLVLLLVILMVVIGVTVSCRWIAQLTADLCERVVDCVPCGAAWRAKRRHAFSHGGVPAGPAAKGTRRPKVRVQFQGRAPETAEASSQTMNIVETRRDMMRMSAFRAPASRAVHYDPMCRSLARSTVYEIVIDRELIRQLRWCLICTPTAGLPDFRARFTSRVSDEALSALAGPLPTPVYDSA